MPELSITDRQLERLDSISQELEAAFVGQYGRVTHGDALAYLLDGYQPPETAETDPEETPSRDTAQQDSAEPSPLVAAAALLEEYDTVWRESDGDAPYEVDLPDGTTETVRTRDEVKGLLFRAYER